MTNKLIDVINEANMKFTLFQETIIWKLRNSQSTIDLIFMFNKMINKIKHCKARLEINQSFDHISILLHEALKYDMCIKSVFYLL